MIYDPEKITFFAKTDARGKNVAFGIKAKDRTRHVYVIGKTGMGKSTLLENMAVQDLRNGEGMAFIDPHGSSAETLLDYIPEDRVKDVLYFAPFDMEHPVSFNVMEDVGADKRHLVVSGLISTFKKIWVDAWSARMEYILSNTLLALLEYPDSTLLGVNRMLSDKEYRKKVVDNVKDPAVKSFWVDEFAKYNERYMQEAGDAIKNKTGQFTANPLIRNIIGQPKSSFDIREMMDTQKIIIMNLSKGLIGETNANLLGSMLITRIYLAAMSRADLSPAQMTEMPNFYFYVDEFQSFANETFANILSEARKYKLNLTIAHQYIEQMEEEVRNAVFGNVGTTIAFRVGPFDAEVLETIFQPQFLAVDICNLGFAQVYLTLMIDGVGSQPFSAVTLPPIELSGPSCKEMVIHESRARYSRLRAEVEKAVTDWHESERKGNNGNGNTSSQRTNGSGANGTARGSGTGGISSRNGSVHRSEPPPRTETSNPPKQNVQDTSERPRPKRRTATREVRGGEERSQTKEHKSEERQNIQRAPENAPSATPSPRRPEQSIEDLRNVLRSIVHAEKTEKKTETDKTENGHKDKTKKREAQQKDGKNENALKNALASALHNSIGQSESKSDKKSGRETEDKQSGTSHVHQKADAQMARTHGNEKEESDDVFNAKKLERMMRVTTADTPPIK